MTQSHTLAVEAAREVALRMLAGAPRTRGQVEQGLLKREIAPEVISELLDRLVGVGLIDDLSYSVSVVKARRDERGLSRRAITAELTRKGVAADVIERALGEYSDDEEDDAAVRETLKRLRRMSHLEPMVRKRRLFAALARKGYPPESIYRAMAHASAQLADEIDLVDDSDAVWGLD